MKNKYLIVTVLLLSIAAVMSFTASNNQRFYYAYNEKIYLNELDNKLIVRYKHSKKSDKGQISLAAELAEKHFEWKDDSTATITLAPFEKARWRDEILRQTDVKTCNPLYALSTGFEMGVTDEIVVRFHNNVTQKDIDNLHKKHRVEIVKTTDIYYLIKVPAGSDALEIANKYQESGLTRFSHPNFICEVELYQVLPNDPYFVNQFSLHNTGQVFTDGHAGTPDADIDAPEAWSITRGLNDVIVAVLDEGVTPNHPDLPNARQLRLNGSNFADGNTNDPSPTGNGNHGNAGAGIIAATQGNNEGIAGIAPNCRIMPIRVFNTGGSGITPQRLADAINFARQNGAHILSCSWGYNSDNPNLHPVIRDAIIAATTQGRNGLGCVVVFAAGNNPTNNGFVHFPANVNVAGVLTVGASDRDDLKAFYSPLGNPASPNNQLLDVVAPSHRAYSWQIAGETWECWSLDIPVNPGYNPVKNTDGGALPVVGTVLPNAGANFLSYTGRFGGTSYSAPQVAGVAALLLSINPNLTQQQVFNILTATADRVGGYVYTNGRSNEFGFGRLNACRAVTQAVATLPITGNSTVCSSNSTYTLNNLPAGCTVSWTHSSNLDYVSGQGTSTYTVKANGSTSGSAGWVEALINGPCGSVPIRRVVWVGYPSMPYDISGFPNDGLQFPSNSYFNFIVWAQPIEQGVNSYEWYVIGGTILSGQSTPQIEVLTDNAINGNIGFVVGTRVGNTCGWSPWLSRTGIVYDSGSGGGSTYTIYPNPATTTVAVSVIESTSATTQGAEGVQPISSIKVYDKMGQMVLARNYPNKPRVVQLNISPLQKGIYLLKVNDAESHTLMKD